MDRADKKEYNKCMEVPRFPEVVFEGSEENLVAITFPEEAHVELAMQLAVILEIASLENVDDKTISAPMCRASIGVYIDPFSDEAGVSLHKISFEAMYGEDAASPDNVVLPETLDVDLRSERAKVTTLDGYENVLTPLASSLLFRLFGIIEDSSERDRIELDIATWEKELSCTTNHNLLLAMNLNDATKAEATDVVLWDAELRTTES